MFVTLIFMIALADKVIPRQLFEVPIQAAVGKRVIARETLSAMRADVTAGLYGGKWPDTLVLPPLIVITATCRPL